jgi:hypothetical protein
MPVLTALDSDELLILKDSWAFLRWRRDISRGFGILLDHSGLCVCVRGMII